MRIIFESDSVRDKILHNLLELDRNLNKDLYVDFDLEIDTAWLDTPQESNKILSKLKDIIDLLSEENTDATWIKYDLDLARNIYRQILTLHGSSNKLFLETVGQDGTSYEEIASKSVTDTDGFYTDYTMYYDILNDKYVFVFGDKDIYTPYYSDHDWECETEEEAWERYNDYNGFEDEDIVEESLYEDTIKTKDGKWTNKGKKGTHGKFNTKKEADAQRRAIYTNGFKGESLEEDLDRENDIYRLTFNKSEDRIADKLLTLTNVDTFWDEVRKLTKTITSDKALRSWERLADLRHNYLLTGNYRYDGSLKEALSPRELQVFAKAIIDECEDIEDLKEVVNEIYWYDKSLFVKINKFPKDKSFEEIKNNILNHLGYYKIDMKESLKEYSENSPEYKTIYKYLNYHLSGAQNRATILDLKEVGDNTYHVDVDYSVRISWEELDSDGIPFTHTEYESEMVEYVITLDDSKSKVVSIENVYGEALKESFSESDFINYNDFLADNFDGWSDDIDDLIKDLSKCAKALDTEAEKLVFYIDYDEDFYAIDDIANVESYISEDHSLYKLNGTDIKFIVSHSFSSSYWIFKNETEGNKVVDTIKAYVSSLNESLLREGMVDMSDDFNDAREKWDELDIKISFDDALEKWNKASKLAEPGHWYAKPLYSEQAWNDMVKMFNK